MVNDEHNLRNILVYGIGKEGMRMLNPNLMPEVSSTTSVMIYSINRSGISRLRPQKSPAEDT